MGGDSWQDRPPFNTHEINDLSAVSLNCKAD